MPHKPCHLSLDALPAYPGGKRRLVPAIFGLIGTVAGRASWPTLALADPFMGAGSVSLAAKAYGFGRVAANDIAERSQTVGRALIANNDVHLSRPAALRLLTETPRVQCCVVPRVMERLMPPARLFFISCWAHLQSHPPGVERDLVALLSMRLLLRCFPMGLATATDAPHAAAGEFDRVSHARLAHYVRSSQRVPTVAAVLATAEKINGAVLPGHGAVSGLDAFEFLARVSADVVYLDPPYAATQSYESAFALVDEFLGAPSLPKSAFSSRTPPLDDLLDSSRDIPVLVMSMNNSLLDAEGVSALVSRHRRLVRLVSVPYRHYGAIASATKNATNIEFLDLGVRDDV